MCLFLQVNVLNLNTDNSLTDFKDVSDEVVKDQDGIVQDYKKSMKKVREVIFSCKEIHPLWVVIYALNSLYFYTLKEESLIEGPNRN